MYMVPNTRGPSPRSHHRGKYAPRVRELTFHHHITRDLFRVKGITNKKEKKKREKIILYKQNARDVREDFVYDRHPETQRVDLDDGYVGFTKHFPYLGSFISYNLKDDFDISKRITKAFQNM